jgi:hypothetical protein
MVKVSREIAGRVVDVAQTAEGRRDPGRDAPAADRLGGRACSWRYRRGGNDRDRQVATPSPRPASGLDPHITAWTSRTRALIRRRWPVPWLAALLSSGRLRSSTWRRPPRPLARAGAGRARHQHRSGRSPPRRAGPPGTAAPEGLPVGAGGLPSTRGLSITRTCPCQRSCSPSRSISPSRSPARLVAGRTARTAARLSRAAVVAGSLPQGAAAPQHGADQEPFDMSKRYRPLTSRRRQER